MNVGIKTMAGEKCKGQWQNAVFAYLYILVGCQLKKTTTTTITVHVMRIMKDILPDWFGKCAKLAKLVGVAVWVGGAAKMSPRSESKSNFFSWAALWAWERASPGDWVVQSGKNCKKKKNHTHKKNKTFLQLKIEWERKRVADGLKEALCAFVSPGAEGSYWAAGFWGVGLLVCCQCCLLRSRTQKPEHLLLPLPGQEEHT